MTTALFYFLLRPVSRSIALVAAFLSLSGCIIKTFSRLFYIAPLFVLGGAQYLSVFSPPQLQALALLFLKVNDRSSAMALAFFGFESLLNGYLVFRSTFLPHFLGILSMIGGLGWLTFLYPPLGYHVFLYVAAFALLGSIAMILADRLRRERRALAEQASGAASEIAWRRPWPRRRMTGNPEVILKS